jgi:hypothetical protein
MCKESLRPTIILEIVLSTTPGSYELAKKTERRMWQICSQSRSLVDRRVGISVGTSCGSQMRQDETRQNETRNTREESETTLNYTKPKTTLNQRRETRNAKLTRPPELTMDRWLVIGWVYLSWRGCSITSHAKDVRSFASWTFKLLAFPISPGPNELWCSRRLWDVGVKE